MFLFHYKASFMISIILIITMLLLPFQSLLSLQCFFYHFNHYYHHNAPLSFQSFLSLQRFFYHFNRSLFTMLLLLFQSFLLLQCSFYNFNHSYHYNAPLSFQSFLSLQRFFYHFNHYHHNASFIISIMLNHFVSEFFRRVRIHADSISRFISV